MIDEVLEYVGDREWCELNKITEMVERYDLTKPEIDIILSFLMNYFIELDEGQRMARLSSWLYRLIKKTEHIKGSSE